MGTRTFGGTCAREYVRSTLKYKGANSIDYQVKNKATTLVFAPAISPGHWGMRQIWVYAVGLSAISN